MTTDERKLTMLRIEWLISVKNAFIMEGNMMTQCRDGWVYDVDARCAQCDIEIEELFNKLIADTKAKEVMP